MKYVISQIKSHNVSFIEAKMREDTNDKFTMKVSLPCKTLSLYQSIEPERQFLCRLQLAGSIKHIKYYFWGLSQRWGIGFFSSRSYKYTSWSCQYTCKTNNHIAGVILHVYWNKGIIVLCDTDGYWWIFVFGFIIYFFTVGLKMKYSGHNQI